MRARDLSHWVFTFLTLKSGQPRTARQLPYSAAVLPQAPPPAPRPGVGGRGHLLAVLVVVLADVAEVSGKRLHGQGAGGSPPSSA